MRKLIYCLLLFIFLDSCTTSKNIQQKHSSNLLESLMKTDTATFAQYLANKDSLRLQIFYTRINRNKKGNTNFKEYSFNLNNNLYFYPASTVKMPIAFLALEKLNEMSINGVNKYTPMVIIDSSKKVYQHGTPTSIANYIQQIFLVSDNEAYNHLYDFLGQAYIQQKLMEKGYPDAIIRHRLEVLLTPEENRTTYPIDFYNNEGKILFHQQGNYNKNNFPTRDVKIGKGYYNDTMLIEKPFDFSLKNRVYLQDLHHILQSVLFPEMVNEKSRFNLSEDDYTFIYKWMSAYPKESKIPFYDSTIYWDTYCKFLFYGSENKPTMNNIRIFNKVGDAYGFLTDIAYLIDKKNNIDFMLSATMLCNKKEIFNSNSYDYDLLGFPFFKKLGELVYNYELKNHHSKHAIPAKFNINYNH